jgi:tRNA pseudouridine55 synthase
MLNGILLIDKEKDITSYDVIRKLKRLLPRKYKIGHAGTLDPFATGLLIIMMGKATKLMNDFHKLNKTYEVKAQFGFKTDTQDITGEKIDEVDVSSPIPSEDIQKCIKENFLGNIPQIPPIYSAKKIHGKAAYRLAREGKEIKLEPKEITINSFEILEYDWPTVSLKVECSTGTYIRTLVNDLGIKLNSLATAIELRRTDIGTFSIKDSTQSLEIDEKFNIEEKYIEISKVKEILENE